MPERGTFGVGENKEIADLLIGLANARKTWGFRLCFSIFATSWGSAGATVGGVRPTTSVD
jgi:hypothetical protein